MKSIFLILFVFTTLNSVGQSLFPIKFENCNTERFIVEGKEIYSECDLIEYLTKFKSKIDPKLLVKIKGQITFQIIIDKTGSPCCQSLKNELNGKGKKVDFKKFIDGINIWGTPTQNGKEVTVAAIIKIVFTGDQIEIQRLGFNMKTGLIKLDEHKSKK